MFLCRLARAEKVPASTTAKSSQKYNNKYIYYISDTSCEKRRIEFNMCYHMPDNKKSSILNMHSKKEKMLIKLAPLQKPCNFTF